MQTRYCSPDISEDANKISHLWLEDLHICARNHIIAGLLEGAVKGVHAYPPNGLLRFTCWSQISHLQELKLHELAKVTTTKLQILSNLSESNQSCYR